MIQNRDDEHILQVLKHFPRHGTHHTQSKVFPLSKTMASESSLIIYSGSIISKKTFCYICTKNILFWNMLLKKFKVAYGLHLHIACGTLFHFKSLSFYNNKSEMQLLNMEKLTYIHAYIFTQTACVYTYSHVFSSSFIPLPGIKSFQLTLWFMFPSVTSK